MPDSSGSSSCVFQYDDDTLNDTEEVGNVLVDNNTICRQYLGYFIDFYASQKPLKGRIAVESCSNGLMNSCLIKEKQNEISWEKNGVG